MSITLDGLALPDDLVWSDEFKSTTVVQNQSRALTGALIIQESVKLEGRPITLVGGMDSGWITRSDVIALQVKVDTVDSDMVLNFHGDNYTVRFSRSGGASPVDATPIVDCTDPALTDPYGITIKLMTV